MKTQKHNQGTLKKLEVYIEQEIVDSFEKMSNRTGMSLDTLVVVALKRFKSSHCDYENNEPSIAENNS